MKIYAEILAGGMGTRMGNGATPKQFMVLGNKPVIVHTVEKFLLHNKIDHILVVVPEKWITHTCDVLKKYSIETSKVTVIAGGDVRTETVLNGIKYIEENFGIGQDDIVITHDAVRPFLTYKIIDDNIENAIKYGATDTVIGATDTIVKSLDNDFITEIPNRKYMYQGQTPQSFNISLLLECMSTLTEEQKNILTDACGIFLLNDKKVKLVEGSEFNIKLTTPFDLILANSILSFEGKHND